jgi:hypothetical protein
MQRANAEDIKGKMLPAASEIEDPNFDRRLDIAVAGCQPFVKRNLLTNITRENAKIIVDYILAFRQR